MKRIKFAGSALAVFFLTFVLFAYAGTNDKTKPAKNNIGAPSALKLRIVPNGIKLSWKPSPQHSGAITGYEIVRSTLASGPFTKVAAVGKQVTEYIDTSAKPENIYYYKVRAVAKKTYSSFTNTVTGER